MYSATERCTSVYPASGPPATNWLSLASAPSHVVACSSLIPAYAASCAVVSGAYATASRPSSGR